MIYPRHLLSMWLVATPLDDWAKGRSGTRNWTDSRFREHSGAETELCVWRSDRFTSPSDNMGDRGPRLVAVVYYHAFYLLVCEFSYVVIISVCVPALKKYFFWRCLLAIMIFLLSVSYFCFLDLCVRPSWITLTGPTYQTDLWDYVNEYIHIEMWWRKRKFRGKWIWKYHCNPSIKNYSNYGFKMAYVWRCFVSI